MGGLIDRRGQRDVLQAGADGFEQGDFVGMFAAALVGGDEAGEFGGLVDVDGIASGEGVAGFVEDAVAGVDNDTVGAGEGFDVDFALVGAGGADRVDVGAGGEGGAVRTVSDDLTAARIRLAPSVAAEVVATAVASMPRSRKCCARRSRFAAVGL